MKKFYMTIVAMLCGVAAMAQGIGTLSCADVTVTAGGEETTYLEVMLQTEDVEQIQGIQFNFTLPEVLSIAKYFDEDEEEWLDDYSFPIAKKDHQVGMKAATGGSTLVYLGGSADLSFRATTRPVLKLGVVAPKTAINGDYYVTFTNVTLADKSKVSYPVDDFTAKVTIVGGTGITSVNADDSNAPVYNLAGQRVNKAQKGVFIQNGKKVAVK